MRPAEGPSGIENDSEVGKGEKVSVGPVCFC